MMRYQMRKWIVYTSSLSSPKKNYPEPGLKRRTNTWLQQCYFSAESLIPVRSQQRLIRRNKILYVLTKKSNLQSLLKKNPACLTSGSSIIIIDLFTKQLFLTGQLHNHLPFCIGNRLHTQSTQSNKGHICQSLVRFNLGKTNSILQFLIWL